MLYAEAEELLRTIEATSPDERFLAEVETANGTETFAPPRELSSLIHRMHDYFIIQAFNHNPNFGPNDALFIKLFTSSATINIYKVR